MCGADADHGKTIKNRGTSRSWFDREQKIVECLPGTSIRYCDQEAMVHTEVWFCRARLNLRPCVPNAVLTGLRYAPTRRVETGRVMSYRQGKRQAVSFCHTLVGELPISEIDSLSQSGIRRIARSTPSLAVAGGMAMSHW